MARSTRVADGAPLGEERLDVALVGRRGRDHHRDRGRARHSQTGEQAISPASITRTRSDDARSRPTCFGRLPRITEFMVAINQWLNKNSLELSSAQNRSWAPAARLGASAKIVRAAAVSAAVGGRLNVSR